jgi:hypothetical protein
VECSASPPRPATQRRQGPQVLSREQCIRMCPPRRGASALRRGGAAARASYICTTCLNCRRTCLSQARMRRRAPRDQPRASLHGRAHAPRVRLCACSRKRARTCSSSTSVILTNRGSRRTCLSLSRASRPLRTCKRQGALARPRYV